MRHLVRSTTLAAAILFGATDAAGFQPAPEPNARATVAWPVGKQLQADPAIRFGTLPNGLRYAIRRNTTPPGEASIRLWIGAGSLHEAEDQRGLAHFLEHMVLNGTRNVPEGEFVKRLERFGLKFGPDTNASTTFTHTQYMLELPETDGATVDTALFLLREVADKATLDSAAIDRERGIILSEERSRATPGFRQLQHELAYLYGGQLLPTRLPIGSTEVIRTAPRQRLLDFYNAYYRPENAVLVIVGDVDPVQIEAKIRAQFGDWKGEGMAGPSPDQGQPARRSLDATIYSDPAATQRITLTWLRPANMEPDSRAKRVRETVEALGFAVLNRRLSRIASSDNPPFVGASGGKGELADTAESTQINAVAKPGQWRRALSIIEQEHRRLLRHGPTKAELEREVTQYRTALESAVAAASTRTNASLAATILGSLEEKLTVTTPEARLALFNEAVKDLSPGQVTATMRPLFSGSGPLLYLATPTPVAGGRQALLSAYRDSTRLAVAPPPAREAQAWPYTSFGSPGMIAERKNFAAIGATSVRFTNGVRLVVRPSEQRKDQIFVRVRVGDGRLDFTPGQPSPEWALAPAFALGGTSKLTAEDLNQALTGKQVSAGLAVTDDAFLLQGATRPADLGVQLQLLAAYLTDPGWRPNGWERLRSIAPALQSQLASTPGGVFGRDTGALLRGGDMRWGTPTLAQMTGSSIGQGKAALAAPLANDPIELIIVGDIKVDDAIREVAATFGALPARSGLKATPFPLAFPAVPKDIVTLTHKGREDQGLAFIAWPTLGFHADPKLVRTLNLLASIYQLRLTERLREQEGVTYSPAAAHSASDVFERYGYLFGRIEAPPSRLPRFFEEAQEIASDLRSKPITNDELTRARKPLLERIQRERAGNEWWLNELAGLGEDPRVLRSIESQVPDYEAITPHELEAAANRFLLPDKAYRLVVVPEKKTAKR